MAIDLKYTQIEPITTATEYTIDEGYFLIMPASVTAGAVLAFKATAEQGFVNIETISTPKIVFIPSTVTFKLTFGDGTVTLTKLSNFANT
jgi:voltage-gated potassium channel Kch